MALQQAGQLLRGHGSETRHLCFHRPGVGRGGVNSDGPVAGAAGAPLLLQQAAAAKVLLPGGRGRARIDRDLVSNCTHTAEVRIIHNAEISAIAHAAK
jgi:hypothetical protein